MSYSDLREFIAEVDDDRRMAAKRLLFRPFYAVRGGRA